MKGVRGMRALGSMLLGMIPFIGTSAPRIEGRRGKRDPDRGFTGFTGSHLSRGGPGDTERKYAGRFHRVHTSMHAGLRAKTRASEKRARRKARNLWLASRGGFTHED